MTTTTTTMPRVKSDPIRRPSITPSWFYGRAHRPLPTLQEIFRPFSNFKMNVPMEVFLQIYDATAPLTHQLMFRNVMRQLRRERGRDRMIFRLRSIFQECAVSYYSAYTWEEERMNEMLRNGQVEFMINKYTPTNMQFSVFVDMQKFYDDEHDGVIEQPYFVEFDTDRYNVYYFDYKKSSNGAQHVGISLDGHAEE